MKTVQKGFTLIELIVVIVILGILSATALPKFIDMGREARISVLQGIQGAAMSAANMAYAKAAVGGKDLTQATGQTVAITGVTGTGTSGAVTLVYGYPAAADIGAMLQDSGGATFSAGVWTLKTGCTATYAVPTGSGASPVVSLVTTSC